MRARIVPTHRAGRLESFINRFCNRSGNRFCNRSGNRSENRSRNRIRNRLLFFAVILSQTAFKIDFANVQRIVHVIVLRNRLLVFAVILSQTAFHRQDTKKTTLVAAIGRRSGHFGGLAAAASTSAVASFLRKRLHF